jgi:hypothetical protein
MKMSEHLDNKRLAEWSHKEILKQESGRIYTVNRIKQSDKYELRNYDLTTQKWQSMTNFNTNGSIPVSSWDVSQSFVACQRDFNSIAVLRKTDFSEIYKIPIICNRVQISKPEQQIAVLQSVGEIAVQKGGNRWFQTLGMQCKLKIFDIASGQLRSEYAKFVLSDGLDWSPDSKKLLIVTLRDTDIQKLENKRAEKHIGVALCLKEFCPKIICMFDISTNSSSELCEGTSPRWNKDGNEFIFTKGDKIFVYNIVTNQAKFLCENYGCSEFYWSASGQNILGLIRTQNPMWTNKYFLTAINVQNPELKYVIDVGENYYGLNWCQN